MLLNRTAAPLRRISMRRLMQPCGLPAFSEVNMSPTARSLAQLRELGYRPAVVEKVVPRTYIKQDCFGVDIIGLKPGAPILAVQCTSGSNVAARIQKLHENGFIELWRSVGAVIEVWGWRKAGPRGTRKTWQLRREAL